MIPHQAARFDSDTVYGNIPILDIQFGNVWTNIDHETFRSLGVKPGKLIDLKLTHGGETVLQTSLPYVRSFGDVAKGESLLYLNSLNNVSLAINRGSFAETYAIQSGADWNVFLSVSH